MPPLRPCWMSRHEFSPVPEPCQEEQVLPVVSPLVLREGFFRHHRVQLLLVVSRYTVN